MRVENLPFTRAHFLSPLLRDYLGQSETLRSLYSAFPSFEALREQARRKSFSASSRTLLSHVLREQYRGVERHPAVLENLSKLEDPNTFTLTTGHQLNLFGGPLYIWYKIQGVINLCQALNRRYPDCRFVPLYWMATEDHDFEEINHFTHCGSLIRWEVPSAGPVGRLSTRALAPLFPLVRAHFGSNQNGKQLTEWFLSAYQNHAHLADATRYLVNTWFGAQGLLALDADSRALKQRFVPYLRAELLGGMTQRSLSRSTSLLAGAGYRVQAPPRAVNLFYLRKGARERLERRGDPFYLVPSGRSFAEAELLKALETHPQRFSPNVLLRPLYQEVILPNLAYLGGAGELAYWLQLKPLFDSQALPFPLLILRNSLLLLSEKQRDKLARFGISPEAFNTPLRELIAAQTREKSPFDLDFKAERAQLAQWFVRFRTLAEKTDKSFLGAVRAQEAKQLKGLERLEKRLLKAEARRMHDQHACLEVLKHNLFPKGDLQERVLNFSTFYRDYGPAFTQALKDALHPLENEFLYLTL